MDTLKYGDSILIRHYRQTIEAKFRQGSIPVERSKPEKQWNALYRTPSGGKARLIEYEDGFLSKGRIPADLFDPYAWEGWMGRKKPKCWKNWRHDQYYVKKTKHVDNETLTE